MISIVGAGIGSLAGLIVDLMGAGNPALIVGALLGAILPSLLLGKPGQ